MERTGCAPDWGCRSELSGPTCLAKVGHGPEMRAKWRGLIAASRTECADLDDYAPSEAAVRGNARLAFCQEFPYSILRGGDRHLPQPAQFRLSLWATRPQAE